MKPRTITLEKIRKLNPCDIGLEEYIENFGERDVTVKELIDWGKYHYWICENLLAKEDEVFILDGKNPEWCYFFAKYVEGADTQALGEVVAESKNPKWCCFFAKDIKGANKKALKKIIMESGDPEWCHYFAKHVEGSDD